ncbi:MAG: hypothetical protein AAF862_02440 [Pseudomonadota bacterium]
MNTDRKKTIGRWVLAGPVSLVIGVLLMASTPTWFPAGAAGVNNLAFAVILFPAYWAIPFFYAIIDNNLNRVSLVLFAALAVNTALVAWSFLKA